MPSYQLGCGDWQTDPDRYGIGGVYPCHLHGNTVVIGYAGLLDGDGDE